MIKLWKLSIDYKYFKQALKTIEIYIFSMKELLFGTAGIPLSANSRTQYYKNRNFYI